MTESDRSATIAQLRRRIAALTWMREAIAEPRLGEADAEEFLHLFDARDAAGSSSAVRKALAKAVLTEWLQGRRAAMAVAPDEAAEAQDEGAKAADIEAPRLPAAGELRELWTLDERGRWHAVEVRAKDGRLLALCGRRFDPDAVVERHTERADPSCDTCTERAVHGVTVRELERVRADYTWQWSEKSETWHVVIDGANATARCGHLIAPDKRIERGQRRTWPATIGSACWRCLDRVAVRTIANASSPPANERRPSGHLDALDRHVRGRKIYEKRHRPEIF